MYSNGYTVIAKVSDFLVLCVVFSIKSQLLITLTMSFGGLGRKINYAAFDFDLAIVENDLVPNGTHFAKPPSHDKYF